MSEDPSVAVDDQHRVYLDDAAEVMRLQQEIDERQKRNQLLLHERDALRDRVEALENTVRLYSRTNGYLPVVGVTCDGPSCNAAIGVVGVTMANADAIGPNAVAIADAIGWLTNNGTHLCPSCRATLKR